MKNWFLLLLSFTMLFMVGCSKQPKIKEKIIYKTHYIYLPCKQTQPLASIVHQEKKPNLIKVKKKLKRVVIKKPVAKRIKFILPKKSVKFFAPKRYITRPNKKMNFMVGYNSDGTTFLYLEGEFNINTYKNFLKYIHESAIDFKEIKINSNGGVVATAMQIGAYVYEHKWKTGVDKEMRCLSACSFVYFAGRKKSLQGEAIVGLHRPYIPNVPDTPRSIRTIKREYISYWNYIHAPKSVYDEMMDVDRDNLFILNRKNINDYIDVTIH